MNPESQPKDSLFSICSRGWCAALLVAVASAMLLVPSVAAQTYTVLYNFTGGADGAVPSNLVLDAQGNLYGTTLGGGNLNCSVNTTGCGTVWKLNTLGQLTVLHTFQGGQDGAAPEAGVLRNAKGEIFGTTSRGGDASCAWGEGKGCGTIFKIDARNTESVLHRFNGLNEGTNPLAQLVQDAAGNLWGTTEYEGFNSSQCFGPGCGTLFKLSPSLKLTTHQFQGPPNDGATPIAGLVFDPAGNLLGTTSFGGTNNAGTIYQVSGKTGQISILHDFDLSTGNAANPSILLVSGGTVYGPVGGGEFGYGALFQLTRTGESLFYNFAGGDNPEGSFVRDSSGNFYGPANTPDYTGVIYKLDTSNNFTVLHYFGGFPVDGSEPTGVAWDSHGNLFGTTSSGGTTGAGTIFKLTP